MLCATDACLLFGWYFPVFPLSPNKFFIFIFCFCFAFFSLYIYNRQHFYRHVCVDKIDIKTHGLLTQLTQFYVILVHLFLFLYWLCMGIGISGFYLFIFNSHSLTFSLSHSCSLTLYGISFSVGTKIRSNTHKKNKTSKFYHNNDFFVCVWVCIAQKQTSNKYTSKKIK